MPVSTPALCAPPGMPSPFERTSGAGVSLTKLADELLLAGETGKEAADARLRSLKAVLLSSMPMSRSLNLRGPDEWRRFLQLVLTACIYGMDARGVQKAHWSLGAGLDEFVQEMGAELANVWATNTEVCHRVVSHLGKHVHPTIENELFFRATPSVGSYGVVASGDVAQRRYSMGAAGRYSGMRHLFDAAAWLDGVWTSPVDELGRTDSETRRLCAALGASDAQLNRMQRAFSADHAPKQLHQSLRQVFVADGAGGSLLLSAAPSVGMSVALRALEAPAERTLYRRAYGVGGTQAQNVSTLAMNFYGQMPLLAAWLTPPQEVSPLHRAHRPNSLLARASFEDAKFLLTGHAMWSNRQWRAFHVPRINALLDEVTAPLLGLCDLVRGQPELADAAPFAQPGTPQAPSPSTEPAVAAQLHALLRFAKGERSKDTQGTCARLLRGRVLAALKGKVPASIVSKLLDETIATHLDAA